MRRCGIPLDGHLLILFTVTTVVAMITPGPDMLFILGCGMRRGARAGLLAAVPVAFTVVRVAGAVYLIHLGVRMLRDRKGGVSELPEPGGGMSGRIGGWLRGKAAARRRVDVATGGILIGLGVKLAVDR